MPLTFHRLHAARPTRAAYLGTRQALIQRGLALFLLFACAWAAWAQESAPHHPKWALEIDRIETIAAVSVEVTLQQVLDGQAGSFKAQTSGYLKDPTWAKALWVRVYLRPTALPMKAADLGNALELSKPYIDDVSLYTPQLTSTGWRWHRQDTGLRYAAREGAIISHLPFLSLPTAAELADQPAHLRFVMLRVQHRLPLSVSVSVKPIGQMLAQSYVSTAMLAMTLGIIALVCLMTAALAWLHRDPAYAWYALYAGAAWFFCASFLGFSHQVIWPVGGEWPITSILFSLLLAMAAKLQFCRWVFLAPDQQLWLKRASVVVGGICVLVCAGFALQEGHWTAWALASIVLICACVVLILVVGAWGVLHNREVSRIWLLAFAPVALTVIYRLLEAVGWANEQWVSFNTGVYALGLEVTVMGVAILWFARNRQSVKERRLALDSTDPMTGFSDAKGFHNDLLQVWQDAKLTQTEVSVAYVALLDTVRNERTMRRIVRILRTVAQEGDSVARLDDGTMALLLVNQGVGEGLSDRLSRIVALGLMPDHSDKATPILRFRIGATSSTHYTSDISGLGADLRRFMTDHERWQGKTIRFLTMRRLHANPSFESSDSFEQFWDQAVDAAAAPQTQK
jgi:hypothetical protein